MGAGLQVTAQRLAVLRAVQETPHVTAEAVCERVRAEIGSVSRQAIYNALSAMCEHGILRSFQAVGSPARYEPNVDEHHHLICRECGEIRDISPSSWEPPCLDSEESHHYRIEKVEVTFWGVCPRCQSKETTKPA